MAHSAICIIPARGGSKRIPLKNIRQFHGKPLVARAIETARASGCFDRIVVSTDNEQIAEIAKAHGAEVPFLRKAGLADDHATTASVIADAIERLEAQNMAFTCCLYPATPLLRPTDLSDALAQIIDRKADRLVPVTEFDYPPLRGLSPDPKGHLSFHFREFALTRSQDLPQLVHDTGSFYWVRTAAFLKDPAMIADNTIGYPMDRLRCVDIDTEDDLRLAEILYAFHAAENTKG